MDENGRVLITGGHSAVAIATKDLLSAKGYKNIVCPDRTEIDLTDLTAVKKFVHNWRPDYVLHIAGRTATAAEISNTPWDIFRDNLLIEYNVFEISMREHIRKVVWISSDSALPYSSNGTIQTENDLFCAPPKKKRTLRNGKINRH